MRGSRGRRRGRRKSKAARSKRSSASSSSSKSSKSKSKRRSTAASKRRRVRSVAKAARAAKRAAKSSTSTSSSKSSSSNNKTKRKVNKLKLNKKDKQRQAQENAKKAFKKKNEQQKNTISASQSRKQAREKAKQARVNRKPISVKNVSKTLSRIGDVTRHLRQPVTGLSNLAVRSVLGKPAIASRIAQSAVNNLGKQNQRTRDMSKLSPQQQRRYQRLSEKTGRDYSIRNPTFRLNMNMRDIARFAGLDKKGWYNKLPRSIREAQVNKQFYGNPMKKGWHSSQRTGRGQGLTPTAATRQQLAGLRADPSQDIGRMYKNILGREADQSGLDYWTNEFYSGKLNMNDIRNQFVNSDEFKGRSLADRTNVLNRHQGRSLQGDTDPRLIKDITTRMGLGIPPAQIPPPIHGDPAPGPRPPKQDWLGDFYREYNIGGAGGNLDQEARDYWTKEAKTKGVDKTMDTIRATAKSNKTWGGRNRPPRVRRPISGFNPPTRTLPYQSKGPRREGPKRTKPGSRTIGASTAAARTLRGHYDLRKRAKNKHHRQVRSVQRDYTSAIGRYNNKRRSRPTPH